MNLRSRLFLSHLLVMLVGVSSFVIAGKLSSPQYFVHHLEQLEGRGFRLRYVRTYLVEGFEISWNRSTVLAVLVGTTVAGGLSYWVAKRITQPLTRLERITQNFASGHLEERLPTSDIPELNQLSTSFNRMADGLEGVEHRRRELISDMTHELRTPLTIVRGYLEELADGRIEPTPEVYLKLAKETKRLERLVNDLQELSQAEAGYMPIHLQAVNLRPLLKGLVEKFADQLLGSETSLQLDCPPELPLVQADLDRTEQILVNLIGNAMRYTHSGIITVKAWVVPKFLWISISDTGEGIAAEDLPHIFERFWRADRSRSRYTGGSGIGLAISRRLVELQQGKIEVESEVGKGSVFRFCLPLV